MTNVILCSESPSRVNELSAKVSCLEQQLEIEFLQKQEALENVESSKRRIADLEKQLEEKSQMPTDEQEQVVHYEWPLIVWDKRELQKESAI